MNKGENKKIADKLLVSCDRDRQTEGEKRKRENPKNPIAKVTVNMKTVPKRNDNFA